jgi:hypothetical protein
VPTRRRRRLTSSSRQGFALKSRGARGCVRLAANGGARHTCGCFWWGRRNRKALAPGRLGRTRCRRITGRRRWNERGSPCRRAASRRPGNSVSQVGNLCAPRCALRLSTGASGERPRSRECDRLGPLPQTGQAAVHDGHRSRIRAHRPAPREGPRLWEVPQTGREGEARRRRFGRCLQPFSMHEPGRLGTAISRHRAGQRRR